MTTRRTTMRHAMACLIGLLLLAPQAAAQTYPTKNITIVVPFPAGGSADVVARITGDKLSAALGQAVIIENRAGAGGTTGTGVVARAEADGHTLLLVTASHAGIGALYPRLSFDPTDVVPVIHLIASPIVVVVNATSKYKTIEDLVADAKARPDELLFAGGAGGATLTNLAALNFRDKLGLKTRGVPYTGSAPALTGLIRNDTHYAFDSMAAVAGFTTGGLLRMLAVTTPKRSSLAPDIPTVSETVIKDFDANVWHGVMAPKGTPQPVIERLNAEFNKILRMPDVDKRLRELSADPVGGSAEDFGKYIASETERWGALIREMGLKPN